MKRRLSIAMTAAISALSVMAQNSLSTKVDNEQMLERFLSYVKIESQSVDEPSMTSVPMTEGQKRIAQYIYDEVRAFG